MRHRFALPLAAAALALGCADATTPPTAPTSPRLAATASAGPAATATMTFGRTNTTGLEHMSSRGLQHTGAAHALDKVYPGTVVIARGGTVTFESLPVHQIAVYAPGTTPVDVRLDPDHLDDVSTPFGDFPDVLINDPANRLALSPVSFEPLTWTPPTATFSRPGRYLVICTVVFHYVEAKMYGWVEVR